MAGSFHVEGDKILSVLTSLLLSEHQGQKLIKCDGNNRIFLYRISSVTVEQ